jgi:ABC-type sugar transport system substrate-binding protein
MSAGRLFSTSAAAIVAAWAFTHGPVARADDAPLVAFAQEGIYNSWRSANNDSILSEAKKNGINLTWVNADKDQSRQVAQVQNLLKLKPKVLIVEPAEQEAATPIAKLADDAGVPLIVADRGLSVPPSGMFKMQITVDWKQVGTELGKSAVEYLKKKNGKPAGNIVEIVGTIGSAPQLGMDEGFKSVIGPYPDIKIVATQDGNNERGPGLSIMEDFLTAHPAGQIDLVYAQNDEMAIGALKAIQAAGRNELVGAIISKDGQLQAVREIANGHFAADCTNTPYFGPILMPYVKDILAGKDVPALPPKPFICISSITPEGQQQAKDLLAEMEKGKMEFSPR